MEQVAQFRILNKIGAGGMGEVYRARDEKLQRDVAIKVVPESQFEDATARLRLIREARSAAGLSHPNICVVHEVGESSGQAYIAMECIEGESLAARITRVPLSQSEVVKFGIQLADALAHAHERGVVHRDLKPQNIIVTPEQRLKVLDFGLAKRIVDAAAPGASTDVMVTTHGVIQGTPAYMSPEQLRGLPADERSDIWAMGVILHEMAARKRPFGGNTWPELSAAILSTPPQPLPADIPPELDAIIRRCLEKEPANRYHSAAEVRSALEVIQTTVTSSRRLALPKVQRRWGMIAAAAIVVIVAITIGFNLNLQKTKVLSAPFTTPAAASRIAEPSVAAIENAVAVLPFTSFAGADEAYLADGMQDAIIGELARVHGLRVFSRTSTLPFKDTKKTATEIATSLGANHVIEGSVSQAGDRVRVQVTLIRTKPQEQQVWAEAFDRDMRDVLSLYGDIAAAVAAQIDSRLAASAQTLKTEEAKKVDPEVYKLYLRGMYQVKKESAEGFKEGMRLLRQANERDPSDPLPYAGIAMAYALGAHSPAGTSDSALTLAHAAIGKALELDPNQGQAHAAQALLKQYGEWNWVGLEDDFKAALRMNPTDPEIRRHYAWYLLLFQRGDEAIAEGRKARDADPLAPLYYSDLAQQLLILGRYEEGIAEARRGLELEPENAYIFWPLGELLVRTGKIEEGLAMHRTMVKMAPEFEWGLGVSLAVAGHDAEALGIAKKLSRAPKGFDPFGLVQIYSELGMNDEAIRWAQYCHDNRVIWTPWVAAPPGSARVRSDPRMLKIYDEMRVPRVARDFGKPRA